MAYRRPGQGRGMPPGLEVYDTRPGRTNYVQRDPISNNFKLHVSNIPSHWTESMVENVFRKCGNPKNVFISPGRGGPFTWGFVEYQSYPEAIHAIKTLNNNVMLDNFRVSFAREKEPEDYRVIDYLINQQDEGGYYEPQLPQILPPLQSLELDDRLKRAVNTNAPLKGPKVTFKKKKLLLLEQDKTFKMAEEMTHLLIQNNLSEKGKCSRCQSEGNTACAGCGLTYYCSESCQSRDWYESHGYNCKGGSSKKPMERVNHSQGDGYKKQSNGFGNDRDGDRRSFGGDKQDRDGDRRSYGGGDRGFKDNKGGFGGNQGGFGDKGGYGGSKGGFSDRGPRDNKNQEKRPFYEERKLKMARQFENDRGSQNNRNFTNNQGNRSSYKPQVKVQEDDEDWGTGKEDSGDKITSTTPPGLNFINKEKEFLKEIAMKNGTASVEKKVEIPELKKEKETKPTEPKEDTSALAGSTASLEARQPANILSKSKYPYMLDETKFNTVFIAYLEPNRPKEGIFFVASTTWPTALGEMLSSFKTQVDPYKVVTPEIGAKGVVLYEDEWYRTEVVSLDPIKVYFYDFGNVEVIQPDGLKKCPATHEDIPPMVQKIKLAPGTDKTYFEIKEASTIPVKPVSKLDDGTVVVHVEGVSYAEVSDANTPSLAPLAPPPSPAPASLQDKPLSPQPQPSPPESTSPKDYVSKTASIVELLEANWTVSMFSDNVNYMQKSITGPVYGKNNFPETKNLIEYYDAFTKCLSACEFDPEVKFEVGDLVGVKNAGGEWARGKVTSTPGLVALCDYGTFVRSSHLLKLPQKYAEIPEMASILTIPKADTALLNVYKEKMTVDIEVLKVTKMNGHTVANVHVVVGDNKTEGELRKWVFEPLETPEPLTVGDKVKICKVVDTNTLLVVPANNLDFSTNFNVDCKKSREPFQHPPKEGDFVAFEVSKIHYRAKIVKIEGDEFEVYTVDTSDSYRTKLECLQPLPTAWRKEPCKVSQIELQNIPKEKPTEEAITYITHLVQNHHVLTVVEITELGKVTLSVEGQEGTLNSKLLGHLDRTPEPDKDGKLSILSLPEVKIPLDQVLKAAVSQTDPLYLQLTDCLADYLRTLHDQIQTHCATVQELHNPRRGELCLAFYDLYNEWYRCRCLRETNTGMSSLMLVDYGNIFETSCKNIREIPVEMVKLPSTAIPCTIQDLPDPVPSPLRTKLDELLAVEKVHETKFIAANEDGSYTVVIEEVKKAIKDLS